MVRFSGAVNGAALRRPRTSSGAWELKDADTARRLLSVLVVGDPGIEGEHQLGVIAEQFHPFLRSERLEPASLGLGRFLFKAMSNVEGHPHIIQRRSLTNIIGGTGLNRRPRCPPWGGPSRIHVKRPDLRNCELSMTDRRGRLPASRPRAAEPG